MMNDMKKHIYTLWAFFILFSQSIAASVEVRSTHMTTGDGVANNSIRYIYQDCPCRAEAGLRKSAGS